jgi:hypothetical protein
MNQFMSRSPNRYAQAPAEAAQWVEFYFPKVDDSLQRLAKAPRSPSLFEKLFSVIVSVTQLSQQPGQRQTSGRQWITAAMNFDIKVLLTLLLLKQGTSSKDIQIAVKLTAAARLMVAEEYADRNETPAASNITNIRSVRVADRPFEPHADAMNSDIKALLMLLLLQNGASSREI